MRTRTGHGPHGHGRPGHPDVTRRRPGRAGWSRDQERRAGPDSRPSRSGAGQARGTVTAHAAALTRGKGG